MNQVGQTRRSSATPPSSEPASVTAKHIKHDGPGRGLVAKGDNQGQSVSGRQTKSKRRPRTAAVSSSKTASQLTERPRSHPPLGSSLAVTPAENIHGIWTNIINPDGFGMRRFKRHPNSMSLARLVVLQDHSKVATIGVVSKQSVIDSNGVASNNRLYLVDLNAITVRLELHDAAADVMRTLFPSAVLGVINPTIHIPPQSQEAEYALVLRVKDHTQINFLGTSRDLVQCAGSPKCRLPVNSQSLSKFCRFHLPQKLCRNRNSRPELTTTTNHFLTGELCYGKSGKDFGTKHGGRSAEVTEKPLGQQIGKRKAASQGSGSPGKGDGKSGRTSKKPKIRRGMSFNELISFYKEEQIRVKMKGAAEPKEGSSLGARALLAKTLGK